MNFVLNAYGFYYRFRENVVKFVKNGIFFLALSIVLLQLIGGSDKINQAFDIMRKGIITSLMSKSEIQKQKDLEQELKTTQLGLDTAVFLREMDRKESIKALQEERAKKEKEIALQKQAYEAQKQAYETKLLQASAEKQKIQQSLKEQSEITANAQKKLQSAMVPESSIKEFVVSRYNNTKEYWKNKLQSQ